jgi:hypothetical protein
LRNFSLTPRTASATPATSDALRDAGLGGVEEASREDQQPERPRPGLGYPARVRRDPAYDQVAEPPEDRGDRIEEQDRFPAPESPRLEDTGVKKMPNIMITSTRRLTSRKKRLATERGMPAPTANMSS